jgi:hypothetical protein
MRAQHGVLPSATRISVGVASNFADVYRFMCFIQRFAGRRTADGLAADGLAAGAAGAGHPWHPAGHRPAVPEPV